MKRIINGLSGTLIVLGFLVVLGSAGSSDLGVITATEFLLQVIGGVLLLFIGFVGLEIGGYEFDD